MPWSQVLLPQQLQALQLHGGAPSEETSGASEKTDE